MTPRPEITAYICYVRLVIALHRRALWLAGCAVRVHPIKLEHIHSNLRRSIILSGLCSPQACQFPFSSARTPAQMWRLMAAEFGTLETVLDGIDVDERATRDAHIVYLSKCLFNYIHISQHLSDFATFRAIENDLICSKGLFWLLLFRNV